MMSVPPNPPDFWRTVRLLLSASRKRAAGRRERQQQLLNARSGKNATNWGGLGFAMTVLFMAVLNGGAAFIVQIAVEAGQRVEVERQGKIVVSHSFMEVAKQAEDFAPRSTVTPDEAIAPQYYSDEASKIAKLYGGTQKQIEKKLLNALRANGSRDFVNWADAGKLAESERRGKIVVSDSFIEVAKEAEAASRGSTVTPDQALAPQYYSSEARRIVEKHGGGQAQIETKLRNAMRAHGARDFVTRDDASPGLSALLTSGPFSAFLGSLVLLLWGVMLVFQGEGLELGLQRRRNPMWEWLFTHPVPSGAIFMADMLAPHGGQSHLLERSSVCRFYVRHCL